MKHSISKENYLKAVYHLQQQQESVVSTNALATALQTTAASVTDMLKKLKAQKLLQYEKYYGVKLTAEGKKIALQIIRKHRIWECFLAKKLGFGWDEVHEIAEELEHIASKKLIDKLEAYLNYPQTDPHGDPIPDVNGKMPAIEQLAISNLTVNTAGTVNGIGDQSVDMLQLLRHKNIEIGTRLEVKKKFDIDGSIEVRIKNQQLVTISQYVAKNLLVTYDNRNQ